MPRQPPASKDRPSARGWGWLAADARAWSVGRNPWVRLPLILWGCFVLARVLTHAQSFTPFDWLNLGIHELGHVLTVFFGQFIHVVSGSIAQVAVPVGSIFMFVRQRDYFGAAFCLCWLAESLLHLSHYIGDARDRVLPLASLFQGEPLHDWHFLLSTLGLLPWTRTIAGAAWVLALLSVAAYLVLGSWLLWRMARSAVNRAPEV